MNTELTRRQLLALLAAAPMAARAADGKWPDKPIRLVVPYPPGGGVDITARLYAARLGPALGVSVVVDNKPGGDGVIGCDLVARSAPDGYTLLLDGPSHAFNVAFGRKLPYNPKDFVSIAQTSAQQLLLVVHADSGIRTTADLIARARKAPGTLNYASSSNSTALPMELFKSLAQVDLRRVPYKGSAAVLTALLAKEVDTSFAGAATAYEQVKSGKLIALGVGDSARSESFSDIPTVSETGVKDFRAIHWTGLFAPKGTPHEIVDIVNRQVLAAGADPAFRKRLLDAGLEPPPSRNAPADWAAFVEAEVRKWGQIVRTSGLTEDR